MKIFLRIFIVMMVIGLWGAYTTQKANAFYCPNSGTSSSFINNHCGIWVCAAGGFPVTCEKQRATFIRRIAKWGCPPLPPYSSCSAKGHGSYKRGQETFEACKAGFSLQTSSGDREKTGRCVNKNRSCVRERGRGDADYSKCGDYPAKKREKPNYIDIKVNGQQYKRQWW